MTTKTKKTIPMPTNADSKTESETTKALSPATQAPQITLARVNLGLLNRAIGMAVETLRKEYPETSQTVLELAQQSVLQEQVK